MTGFRPSDLLALSREERRLMTWLMRRGESSLEDLMQHLALPAEAVRDLLVALACRGLISDSGDGAGKRYRAKLGST
jgi:DNA-binding IclR family transcriptional regulator